MPEQTVRTKVPLIQELSGVRQWTPEDAPKTDQKSPLIEEIGAKPESKKKNKPKPENPLLLSEIYSKPLITEVSTKNLKSADTSKTNDDTQKKKTPVFNLDYVHKSENGKTSKRIELQVQLPNIVSTFFVILIIKNFPIYRMLKK